MEASTCDILHLKVENCHHLSTILQARGVFIVQVEKHKGILVLLFDCCTRSILFAKKTDADIDTLRKTFSCTELTNNVVIAVRKGWA